MDGVFSRFYSVILLCFILIVIAVPVNGYVQKDHPSRFVTKYTIEGNEVDESDYSRNNEYHNMDYETVARLREHMLIKKSAENNIVCSTSIMSSMSRSGGRSDTVLNSGAYLRECRNNSGQAGLRNIHGTESRRQDEFRLIIRNLEIPYFGSEN